MLVKKTRSGAAGEAPLVEQLLWIESHQAELAHSIHDAIRSAPGSVRGAREAEHMYGDPVDIEAFLQRPLLARVATNGPTLRPLWYLYEEETFWWLTDTANVLCRAVDKGEPIVLVVDDCDLATGEVVHVRARGRAEIVAVDRDRAMRKFARYLGPDKSAGTPALCPRSTLHPPGCACSARRR